MTLYLNNSLVFTSSTLIFAVVLWLTPANANQLGKQCPVPLAPLEIAVFATLAAHVTETLSSSPSTSLHLHIRHTCPRTIATLILLQLNNIYLSYYLELVWPGSCVCLSRPLSAG